MNTKLSLVIFSVLVDLLGANGVSTEHATPRTAYREWLKTFGGNSGHLQSGDIARFKLFLENFKFIEQFRAKEHDFTMELNEFADKSAEELKSFTGLNMTEVAKQGGFLRSPLRGPATTSIPDEKDHRFETGLSVPRHQSYCGSCWSFSSVTVLESRYKTLTDEVVLLSEQELIDCAYKDGRNTCNGGFMTQAFVYLKEQQRMADRRDYSYTRSSGSCTSSNFKNHISRVQITSHRQLAAGDDTLRQEIATNGPVAVAVHASRALTFYKWGVYDGSGCSGEAVNHAVVAVGYRPDSWIIRNSWGVSWGLNGYAYFTRSYRNVCQISSFPVTVTVKKAPDADDECIHVPEHNRQPCWDVSVWGTDPDQGECERQGCCWDPSGVKEKCFVKAKITLYTKTHYGGVSATFYGSVSSLYEYDFMKIAHSVKVYYGKFIVYEKVDYGDDGGWSLAVLGRGGYPDLDDFDVRAAISSVRALPQGDIVTLFRHTHGRGASISIHQQKSNVGDDWNDATSSIYSTQTVEVCRDTGYRRCVHVGAGLTGTLDCNDCLSSVKVAAH